MTGRRRRHGFRRRDARAAADEGPDMTPMVDVVLVILVFFMTATAVLGREWFLDAEVAQADRDAARLAGVELPTVEMRVKLERDPGGRTRAWGFGGDGVGVSEMADRILRFCAGAATDKARVVIEAGDDVRYEDVVRIHEACKRGGITRVSVPVGG